MPPPELSECNKKLGEEKQMFMPSSGIHISHHCLKANVKQANAKKDSRVEDILLTKRSDNSRATLPRSVESG